MKETKLKIIVQLAVFIFFVALFMSFDYMNNPTKWLENIFYRFDSISRIILYILRFVIIQLGTLIITMFYINKKNETMIVLETIPQPIIVLDFNARIEFANRCAYERYGYKPKDVVGRNVTDFLEFSDKQKALVNMKNNLKNGQQSWSAPYTIIDGWGNEIHALTYSAIYKKNKIILTAVDNSELESAKSSYKNQIEFFWSMLNEMPTPLAYEDKEGKTKFANNAYLDSIGLREFEVLGKSLEELLPLEEAQRIIGKKDYVLRANEPIDFNDIITLKNKKHVLDIHMVPRQLNQEVKGVFISFQDITSEKIKEKKLTTEVSFNSTLSQMAEAMASANTQNLYALIHSSLKSINEILGTERSYLMFRDEKGDLNIKYESVSNGSKPYEGFTIELSKEHKDFYKKLLDKKSKIHSSSVKLSKFSYIKHLQVFKCNSFLEVSITKSMAFNKTAVLGVATHNNVKWNEHKIDFMFSAGRIIMNAIGVVDQINELKLSEETLNTLIDDTDIGIVITEDGGKIYYSNKSFSEMFGLSLSDSDSAEGLQKFAVEKLVTPEYRQAAKDIFKEREYKGFAGGTLRARGVDGDFYIKIYSARIDYEGSKAYLTTIVNISEYKN